MKKALLAAGVLLSSAAAFAQDHDEHSYNITPFHTEVRQASVSNMVLQTVQANFPGWQVASDRQSGSPHDLYGPALTIPGADLSAKTDYLFANALSALGLQAGDWQLSNTTNAPRATYKRYTQEVSGRAVVFSRLDFRFTQDGRLQRVVMRHFGQPDATLAPTITAADALTAAAAGLPAGSAISSATEGSGWVWFPAPSERGYTLHPAWPFRVEGVGEDRVPFILTGYVDALDGKLLYRTNEVQTDADLKVKGVVNTQDAVTPPTLVSLKNLEVTIGGTTYNTDTGGYVNAVGITLPQTATVSLRGPWSVVRDAASANITPSFPTPITALGGTYIFPDTTPSSIRHINAYYHTDSVHNHMKRYLPSFTGMDVALQTNVDVAGSCNAFYNGTSINFFAEGGGCISLALARDVVYHEYGHGINGRFYQSQGTSFQNGAMNEGNSDVWGMSITGDPVLGKGMFGGSASSSIRRYDGAPKVYPQDIVGEVHADGEIIAGAWWDTYLNIGSLDTMTQLFSQTYFDLPNGPNGTEGEVYHEVLISALMADDDDANITNGTPHFLDITSAFALHGIYLLSDARLEHTEIPHPAAGVPIPVSATLTLSQPAFFNALKIFFRTRGTTAWDSLTMTSAGGNVWTASLPAMNANTFLEYYFAVYDLTNPTANAIFPAFFRSTGSTTTSNIVYQAGVGIAPVMVEAFDTPPAAGWRVGNNTGDDATAGIWIQAEPVGSFLNSAASPIPVQPDADHSPSADGACLVTANAPSTGSGINTADVDNGTTTVISPFYSLAGYTNPVLEYWRWFSNDRGSNPRTDYWRVQIRRTATSAWLTSVDYTNAPDASWRRRVFAISQLLPGADSFQMRIVAQDAAGTGSTVEGAFDDFAIYDDANLAVKDAVRNTVSLFPNPANDVLTVVLERGEAGTMTLHNTTGQTVMQQAISRGQARYSLATQGLAPGLYLLIVRGENGVQTTHKVSVQR